MKTKKIALAILSSLLLLSGCKSQPTISHSIAKSNKKASTLQLKVASAFENASNFKNNHSKWFNREEKLPLTIISTGYIDSEALNTKEYKMYKKLISKISQDITLLDTLSGKNLSSKYSSIRFVDYNAHNETKEKFNAAYTNRHNDKDTLTDVLRPDIEEPSQELLIRLNYQELLKGNLTIEGYKTVKQSHMPRNSYYYTLRKTDYSKLSEDEQKQAIVNSLIATLQLSIPEYVSVDRKEIVKYGEVLRFFLSTSENVYRGLVYSHESGGEIGKLEHRIEMLDSLKLLKTLQGENGLFSNIKTVAISHNGKFALTGGDDDTIKYWNLRTGEILNVLIGHSGNVNSVKFSYDDNYALSASNDDTLKYWNLKTGKLVRTLTGHKDSVTSCDISHDGHYGVSVSEDRALIYWDLRTAKALKTMREYTEGVNSVFMSQDGTLALTGSTDGNLRLWDLKKKRRLKILQSNNGPINAAVISKDNSHAIASGTDNRIINWNLNTAKGTVLEGHTGIVRSLSISPDDKYVLSGSDDGSLIYWNLQTGKNYKLTGHEKEVVSVIISADGGFALSVSKDKTLRQWKLLLTEAESQELKEKKKKLAILKSFAQYREDDKKQNLLTTPISDNDLKTLFDLNYVNFSQSSNISMTNIQALKDSLAYNFIDPVITSVFPSIYQDKSNIEVKDFILAKQINSNTNYDLDQLYFVSDFDYEMGGYKVLYKTQNITNLKDATEVFRKEY